MLTARKITAVVFLIVAIALGTAQPSVAGSPPAPISKIDVHGHPKQNHLSILWRPSPGATQYLIQVYQVLNPGDRRAGSFDLRPGLRVVLVRTHLRLYSGTATQLKTIDGFNYSESYLVTIDAANRYGRSKSRPDIAITGEEDRYLPCALVAATIYSVEAWSNSSLTLLSYVPGPVGRAAAAGGDTLSRVTIATNPTPENVAEYSITSTLKGSDSRVVRGVVNVYEAAKLVEQQQTINRKVNTACG